MSCNSIGASNKISIGGCNLFVQQNEKFQVTREVIHTQHLHIKFGMILVERDSSDQGKSNRTNVDIEQANVGRNYIYQE